MKKKNIDILKIVAINGVVVLLILSIFEYYLEHTNPENSLPFNGFIGDDYYTWGHQVQNNSLGFREREFNIQKPDEIFRVMVVGDSLTWGAGLAVEQRYTNLTEDIVNNELEKLKVEILNFAYSGAPTTLEKDLLMRLSPKIKPDLIVVGFCYNDTLPHMSGDWSARDTLVKFLTIIAKPLYWISLDKSTNFIINEILVNFSETIGIIPDYLDSVDRLYDKSQKEWNSFKSALTEIQDIANKLTLHQPVFLVLNQAVYTDKPTSFTNPDERTKRYLNWYRQAEDLADKLGFATYNFEQEISNELYGESLVINKLDGHPSAILNTAYSKKLASHILKLINDTSH